MKCVQNGKRSLKLNVLTLMSDYDSEGIFALASIEREVWFVFRQRYAVCAIA